MEVLKENPVSDHLLVTTEPIDRLLFFAIDSEKMLVSLQQVILGGSIKQSHALFALLPWERNELTILGLLKLPPELEE